MAFPATPLDVEVSLALSADLSDPSSWVWTDITAYVREGNRIRIRRGRSSERSTIPPSRCTLTVDNTDGRFCRFLPTGTWYGQIGKNTPLRVRVNNGSGYVTRFVGYVSGWPPSWDPSEQDQTVSLTADGILRRLGQGRALKSALHRAILADGPAQFWALDDESGSTRAASALASGVPMTVIGAPTFGDSDAPAGGADASVDIEGGSLRSVNFALPASGGYSFELCAKLTGTPVPSTDNLWRLRFASSTLSLDADEIPEDDQWHHILFQEEQVGADVVREIWKDGVLDFTFTFVGSTLLYPVGVQLNLEYPAFSSPLKVAYAAVHPHANVDAAARYQALLGWAGEMAHDRVDRLCTEEGVPVTVTATTSQPMGAQTSNTLIALLRECGTTDFGLLYEPLDAGLAYLSSTERYNRAAALTLQYDQGHIAPPWDPSDDDRDTRNDVTASRRGGSSARVTDEASIAAIDVYDDTVSVNTETDEQLNDVAGWAVNLGTVDELRWPAVKPNFLDHPSLIDDWMAADLGSQLHVTGHPSPLAPDEIEQIIEGYDETFGSFEYTAVANLSPASGWRVAVLDDDDLGKLDTAGCVMQAGATSGATSFTVATTVLPRWTTDAGEMPIPILVSGQVNSVTAVANVSPSFVAAGTVAHANNASVTPTMPAGVQAGDLLLVLAAIRNSGTGTVDTPSGYTVLLTSGNMTLLGKVHTGTESAPTITFTGGVANADTSAQMAAFRGTGITVHASTAQLNTSAQNIAHPAMDVSRDNCVVVYLGWKADDWTSVTGPGTEIGEPDTTTGDDQGIVWAYTIQTTATAIATGSFTVTGGASAISRGAVIALATDVQTMSVTRGVNNVTKAIPIGAQVNVFRPARLAL